jgi:hypothetical protein
VGASLDVVNGVRVGVNLVVVAVVVLEGDVDNDPGAFRIALIGQGVSGKGDRLRVDDTLAAVQEADVFGDAVLEKEAFLPVVAFVLEGNLDSRIEEGEFAQSFGEDIVFEFAGREERSPDRGAS